MGLAAPQRRSIQSREPSCQAAGTARQQKQKTAWKPQPGLDTRHPFSHHLFIGQAISESLIACALLSHALDTAGCQLKGLSYK